MLCGHSCPRKASAKDDDGEARSLIGLAYSCSTYSWHVNQLVWWVPPPPWLVESWSCILFRLQNIEYTGLIRKIFRNKDLKARNGHRIQLVAQGKCCLPGCYFKELKLFWAGFADRLWRRTQLYAALSRDYCRTCRAGCL